MPLPALIAAAPAIAKGVGIVGGLVGGIFGKRKADKMQQQAIRAQQQEYAGREPFRAGAQQHLLAPLGINPATGMRVGPGQASDFGAAQGMYGQAGQQYGAANLAPIGAEAARARGLAAGQLEGVGGAPSRQDIALQRFQDLLGQTEEQRQLGTRAIGQSAAKFGRMGSGMVTTDLGNLEERLQTGLQREARGLAADTAAQEEADRLNRLQATLGAAGQFGGEDYQRGMGEAGLALQRGGAYQGLGGELAGLEQARFGQGQALRDEERGERDFTSDLYQQGLQNRLAFGGELAGIGYRPPDTSALEQGAQTQGQRASDLLGGAAGIAGEWMRQRAGAPEAVKGPIGTPIDYTPPINWGGVRPRALGGVRVARR